jgi:hypothetical protein
MTFFAVKDNLSKSCTYKRGNKLIRQNQHIFRSIYIPKPSSDKLVKNVDTNVLFAFLKPFIQELGDTFINGFPISYAYPGSYISEELIREISLVGPLYHIPC